MDSDHERSLNENCALINSVELNYYNMKKIFGLLSAIAVFSFPFVDLFFGYSNRLYKIYAITMLCFTIINLFLIHTHKETSLYKSFEILNTKVFAEGHQVFLVGVIILLLGGIWLYNDPTLAIAWAFSSIGLFAVSSLKVRFIKSETE